MLFSLVVFAVLFITNFLYFIARWCWVWSAQCISTNFRKYTQWGICATVANVTVLVFCIYCLVKKYASFLHVSCSVFQHSFGLISSNLSRVLFRLETIYLKSFSEWWILLAPFIKRSPTVVDRQPLFCIHHCLFVLIVMFLVLYFLL